MGDAKQAGIAVECASSLADQAVKWVNSSSGRDALSQSIRSAVVVSKQVLEAQRLDPKLMQEPITR